MNKLIVILGPTASGKTDLAIKSARKFNGEIVCADSRQIYKDMRIGTASPMVQNQKSKRKNHKKIFKGIPHHLFHIISPKKRFSVAQYQKLAIKTIKNIQKRGKMPFLVGGTGLYVQSVVDNIQFPKSKPNQKLRKELEAKTVKELFGIYEKLDLRGAKLIDKNNKRRLIRAIEVCRISGNPFWEQRQKATPSFDVLQIGIKVSKNELAKRIEKRTEKMFKMGLEKEVKKLVGKYGFNIPTMKTIGYQEFQEYFNSKISKPELKEKIAKHTLQFSKRQLTWFKKDNRIHWVKNYSESKKIVKKFLNNNLSRLTA